MSDRRTSAREMRDEALDSACAAFEAAHIKVADVTPGEKAHPPVIHALVDDRPMHVAVYAMAYCTGERARELVSRHDGQTHIKAVPMLVAARITSDARAVLSRAQWSWLDRRGRLCLRGPGIRIDVAVSAPPATAAPDRPITGRSGRAIAYWLCAHPGQSLSPTRHAPVLKVAPSTISVAVRRLAAAGLVGTDGTGTFPELFWELAAVWRPQRTWLASIPSPPPGSLDAAKESSWRRTGAAAAAAYGAPVVTTRDGTVELYVPAPMDVSVAVRRYGAAQPGLGAAVVAVAPANAIVAPPEPHTPVIDGWPAAPVTAIALDLAQDQARGRQILQEWKAANAVWR